MTRLAACLLVPIRYRLYLVAVSSAGRAAAFVADRRAVRVLPAPELHLLLLGALDTPLAHLPVVLNLSFRELSVLPEDDIEAEAEYAEAHKYYSR